MNGLALALWPEQKLSRPRNIDEDTQLSLQCRQREDSYLPARKPTSSGRNCHDVPLGPGFYQVHSTHCRATKSICPIPNRTDTTIWPPLPFLLREKVSTIPIPNHLAGAAGCYIPLAHDHQGPLFLLLYRNDSKTQLLNCELRANVITTTF